MQHHRCHHRSPVAANTPAGQTIQRPKRRLRADSNAPFALQCQWFLSNLIAQLATKLLVWYVRRGSLLARCSSLPGTRDIFRGRPLMNLRRVISTVVHRLAAFRGGALGGRTGKCGQSPRNAPSMLADFGVFFGLERLAVIVYEGAEESRPDASRTSPQNRSIPNMNRSATVTAAEISNDPRHPSRFEKKKNMLRSAYGYRPGRSTTLITPSSLSRNFLYIAGASSRLAGCVTTKLGSILPSSMSFRRGLV